MIETRRLKNVIFIQTILKRQSNLVFWNASQKIPQANKNKMLSLNQKQILLFP